VFQRSHSIDEFALAVEMIAQGCFDPRPLFMHTFNFQNLPEAYDTASQYKDYVCEKQYFIPVMIMTKHRASHAKIRRIKKCTACCDGGNSEVALRFY
jgi:hypothetical protein